MSSPAYSRLPQQEEEEEDGALNETEMGVRRQTPASAPAAEALEAHNVDDEGNEEEGGGASSGVLTLSLLRVGEPPRTVTVPASQTVGAFKREQLADALDARKRVRLIFMGRVLSDDNASLAACGVRDGAAVHCAVSDAQEGGEGAHGPSSQGGNAGDLEEGQAEALWQLRQAQLLNDDGGEAFGRQGSMGELLLGFVMGLILGILSLIWLWSRMSSRRLKIGIVLGVLVNFSIQMASPANSGDGG